MRIIPVLFALIVFPPTALAQIPGMTRQKVVDSLFTLLPGAKGTVRVDLLNQLSMELAPRNFDSAFRYASQARRFSEAINYPKGKGVAVFNLGNCYFFRPDIRNALQNYHTALRMLEPFEPLKEVGNVVYQIGAVNQYVCNTKKVTAYFKRAAWNFRSAGDSLAVTDAYATLAGAYFYIYQNMQGTDSLEAAKMIYLMDSAIIYNRKALDYFLFPGRTNPWMSNEAVLANLYTYHACLLAVKEDSMALYYYMKALEQAKMIKNVKSRNFLEGLTLSNLGANLFYFHSDSLDKGYEYVQRSIELLKKTNRFDILTGSLMILAEIEIDKGRYEMARGHLSEAIRTSEDFLSRIAILREPDPRFRLWGVTQLRSCRIIIFTDLVHVYEMEGNFKTALHYQEKLESEISLQSRDELTRQVIGMEADYENELKRQEIDGLRKDNELRQLRINQIRIVFAGIGGTLLVAFLAFVLLIQRKRFRTEQRSMVLEQKLLRSQMNPHFIFNSLTNIQNFILTERSEKASLYLTKFAVLVRSILDNSVEEYVGLEKEIDTLENYLDLQAVRFAGKFDYRIRVADEIDTETLKIPPMLAQPFIENAIEHGIKHRDTPGHLEIRFTLKGNLLVFEVEDDGVGRVKAREIGIALDPQHKSIATSLTLERIANLNRKLKEKISLEITDLKNALGQATGTKVEFSIPV